MAVNTAFQTNNLHTLATERSLYQYLIKEAIQIYGHDVYYVNRTTVALDNVLGEDTLSKFTTQHPIEMYVEDAEGFGGDKEIIQQFGLENRNEITFVVSKERFQDMDSQITIEDATDTSSGGSILLESGTISQSDNSSVLTSIGGDNFYILMDTATTDADRPLEGDLVYHPVLAKMFEISFVDHDEPFYQLDNNPVYKLRCKQYEYSGEIIDTGISTIDAIEDDLSEDTSQYQFTLEQTSAYNESIALEFSTNFTYTDIFDDIYLKRYATALIKRQWGANLSKFTGIQMLGGVEMNGSEIYSQAEEEITKLEEEMKLAYELPLDYMVG